MGGGFDLRSFNMKRLIVLLILFIALAPLTGCAVGFYGRLGDQKLVFENGNINQESKGEIPSGLLPLLEEFFK